MSYKIIVPNGEVAMQSAYARGSEKENLRFLSADCEEMMECGLDVDSLRCFKFC